MTKYSKMPPRTTQELRSCWQKFVILILQNIRNGLAKKNQRGLICGVGIHFHKHFDQTFIIIISSLFIYLFTQLVSQLVSYSELPIYNKCILYTTIVENCISHSSLLTLPSFVRFEINAYYEGQIPFIAISCNRNNTHILLHKN